MTKKLRVLVVDDAISNRFVSQYKEVQLLYFFSI
jgi:hypothetical protein